MKSKLPKKFYPLELEEWIHACKELSSGARDVLYYIRAKDPYSNGIDITAAAIARDLGVNRSTVSRAIKELDKAGLLPDWFEIETYDNPEYQVVQRLKSELGGQTEVVTAIGRIDLLTDTEVIEVKQVSEWKAALGQILTYAAFFPEHTKRIHLFGNCTPEKRLTICSTVLGFGVIATFEEVKDEN
ncbi:MarR family transcriptional regulator [Nodularia sphaerocarpa]|uniref:MarR family transcriptional regulator n=1 Tax=Nodularia sphaerocarpa TaxID=137816 RepID=UPI0023302FCB|nr:helix-turn-helix domain-containing protein [Nodularia sphaerocarpa]MDB9372369.1 helix-turn-helix domain-containing protein [Nodularia sphaerocarpa CS-585]MDB9377985.1 helix-turn-helix domain-containing protein [Nodularia sphaerocarpa CS-585A2]